ncbi:hypothetical protein [Geobacter benzoatilyticus]|uniref:Secreted protein n=1 Tax=Geobacter benzoatilyticus TaxID=2815309 RepID=A0ABX7Q0M5_9BACT|nr:hypothetical protein [Geobacter benzoatilyticus]QSV44952.1 hypothetical protein JZM60_12445 [Geobacter benzoatilyticus]
MPVILNKIMFTWLSPRMLMLALLSSLICFMNLRRKAIPIELILPDLLKSHRTFGPFTMPASSRSAFLRIPVKAASRTDVMAATVPL